MCEFSYIIGHPPNQATQQIVLKITHLSISPEISAMAEVQFSYYTLFACVAIGQTRGQLILPWSWSKAPSLSSSVLSLTSKNLG